MAIAAVENMIDYLRRRLDRYADAVVDECALGLTDEARKAEDLFMHIFNEAGKSVGFEFYNLNGALTSLPTDNETRVLSELNFPGVDLADDKNGVCVQITFQSSNFQKKIDNTIRSFYKHELNKIHTRIWVVFASQKRAPNVRVNGHDKNLTLVLGMQDLVDWVRYQNSSFDDNNPIERAYNCVNYWLDSKQPSSYGVIDADLHHEKAVAYQKELNKISSQLFYRLERCDHCRDIDLEAYATLRKFTNWRKTASIGVGSTFKKWSQLPVFRVLEEKIDTIADSIVRNLDNFDFGFDLKFPQGWMDSYHHNGYPTGYRSFQHGKVLNNDEMSHCTDVRRKLLQLRDLIDKHRTELSQFGRKPY